MAEPKGFLNDEETEARMAPVLVKLREIEKARRAPAERARTKDEIEGILLTIGKD